LLVTARVSAICSILGSGGCIFLFLYLQWWKVSTHHIIVFHMSCADILYSSFVVVGTYAFGKTGLCNFQGWILQFCGQVSQMWCTLVGINLLLQMALYWKDRRCREMLRWYYLFVYGIGLTTASVVAAQGRITELGTWCWVGPNWPWDRMAYFYIPLWLCFALNLIIVTLIVRALGRAMKKIPKDWNDRAVITRHYRWLTLHTSMFVLVGMVIWLPGTVYRIWQIKEETPPYELLFLQKVLLPAQGFFNFLVYVAPIWLRSIYVARRESLKNSKQEMSELGSKKKDFLGSEVSRDVETDSLSDDSNNMFSACSAKALARSRINNQNHPEISSLELSDSSDDAKRRETGDPEIAENPRARRALIHDGLGRIGRLNEPMEFHNYSLVQVEDGVRPVWEIQEFLDVKNSGNTVSVVL